MYSPDHQHYGPDCNKKHKTIGRKQHTAFSSVLKYKLPYLPPLIMLNSTEREYNNDKFYLHNEFGNSTTN